MDNPWTGEVTLALNGSPYRMKLTLGALAALEQRLACGSLVDLVQRFETGAFSATDVLALLAAGLQGAGHDIPEDQLARAEITGGPMAATRAAAHLLARAFALPSEP